MYIAVLFTTIILLKPIFAVNFSEDISPIIYNNCTICHRSGEIGSFLPFTNYQVIFDNRYLIAYAIHDDDDRALPYKIEKQFTYLQHHHNYLQDIHY